MLKCIINKASIEAQVVVTGAASRMQKQVAKQIQGAKKAVFIDNFDYDTSAKSFERLMRLQQAADLVRYPDKQTLSLFKPQEGKKAHAMKFLEHQRCNIGLSRSMKRRLVRRPFYQH